MDDPVTTALLAVLDQQGVPEQRQFVLRVDPRQFLRGLSERGNGDFVACMGASFAGGVPVEAREDFAAYGIELIEAESIVEEEPDEQG